MADHALGNAEYFRSIDEEMAAGGAAALLGFLLRYDLAGLELRDIPETRALADQKLESMDALEAWWHDRLCDGEIRGCEDEAWQTGSLAVPKDGLYLDYCAMRTAHRGAVSQKPAAILKRPGGAPRHGDHAMQPAMAHG